MTMSDGIARGSLTEQPTPARRMLPVARLLLASPDRQAIGRRLTAGHGGDPDGWCRHPAHEGHPETHPCSMLRVVALADRLAVAESDTPDGAA
jgi:hypothetical protein